MTTNIFHDTWRITWMSGWDQDYVDMEGPGQILFGPGQSGSFSFGALQAQMDCRASVHSTGHIEFTWHGFDEGDEISGRGHASIVNGELHGHLYFHLGVWAAEDVEAKRAKNEDSVVIPTSP